MGIVFIHNPQSEVNQAEHIGAHQALSLCDINFPSRILMAVSNSVKQDFVLQICLFWSNCLWYGEMCLLSELRLRPTLLDVTQQSANGKAVITDVLAWPKHFTFAVSTPCYLLLK